MKKKDMIEEHINKTLAQFDNAEQLPPNPYFYTRIQARLEEKQKQRTVFSAVLKPAMLTALVILNLSTALWYLSGNEQQAQSNTRAELVELLSNDLSLNEKQSTILGIN